MGTCCCKSAGHKHLSLRQKDKLNSYKNLSRSQKNKLNSILEELVTKAGVDFSCPEIQDIQSAISEMIERIKTVINERGVFSISRTEVCGSIAEKTAMWKLAILSGQPLYIEFDFLAVLKAACDIKPGCQECFYVNTPPMNLDLLEKYYRSLYNSYLKDELNQKEILEECFTRETNNCLASCGCQQAKYLDQENFLLKYTFEPSSTCSKTQQGCDKCAVDRPTGTLRVKTSVRIGDIVDCTLVFQWTSKAKTLCTRDWNCLPKTEKMDNLTIHVDFLPALEVFQSKQQSADVAACSSSGLVLDPTSSEYEYFLSALKLFQSKQQSADVAACSSSGLVLNPTSSEYEHYCFLVAKHCGVCNKYSTWRRSGCRAEIDTIVNKMSDKHRNCYQVLKHLTGLTLNLDVLIFYNYNLKIASLHHNSSCSDCAECVFKVLDEFQHAYETRQLKSLHSEENLLGKASRYHCGNRSSMISRLKLAMCSAVSESDSVSSFLKKVKNLYL